MRAIAYFRADAQTLPPQHDIDREQVELVFQDFCYLNLHQPMKTFTDSAPSEDGAYPGYRAMMDYIRESGYDFLVAVPDASHLGADLESAARAFLEIESVGSETTCQDNDMPDPLQSALEIFGPPGTSRARSEKVRMSMQRKALDGKGLGRPPYGYRNGDDGSLTIVPEEAEVVRLIFRLYTEAQIGMRLIVQHLNRRGITTRKGGNWSVVSIRDILKNPAYIGTYIRFGLRMSGAHEPIITREAFRAAGDIVRQRRPRLGASRAEPYLLSGIIYCDYCGNKMMGVTRRQLWKTKNGDRKRGSYRYYQCQARNNQSVCDYHTWREADLEGATLSQIPLALEARRLRRRDSDDPDEAGNALKSLWAERVTRAERRFVQAMRKTASGAVKTDHLREAVAALDKARDSAARAESPVPTDADEILQRWDELDFDRKRDFLITNIARIEVRDHMARVIA